MIFLGLDEKLFDEFKGKYPNNILCVDLNEFKHLNTDEDKYPINFLKFIKTNIDNYDIIYCKFSVDLTAFLTTLRLSFNIIYSQDDKQAKEFNYFQSVKCNKIVITEDFSINKFLEQFEWYQKQELLVSEEHKMKTLQDLIDTDAALTDLDIRDVKVLQNKLKMGVLLQAKTMLQRVLKLTNILDKLYDELLTRIENNIGTTDTASLMYTTDYISKALSETNQFIMSLVNNEKIQNFFIIDNSTVINTNNNTLDIEKREKLRKAAEIVLNNYDYLVENKFDKVVNPNEVKEENNGDKVQ